MSSSSHMFNSLVPQLISSRRGGVALAALATSLWVAAMTLRRGWWQGLLAFGRSGSGRLEVVSPLDSADDDEVAGSDGTPVARADPPRAGPQDMATSFDPEPDGGLEDLGMHPLCSTHQEAPIENESDLDAGLRALGMLSSTPDLNRQARRPQHSVHQRDFQDGVDGADDVVVVERVSPEEEERRYWAMLNGGDDLFSDLPAPESEKAKKKRPVVGYDS